MAAAEIGIVEQEDVARLDVLEAFLDRQRRPWQRADMARQVVGLCNQPPTRVANRQRKIAAGIEDLGIGGAKHGLAHLFYDRTEPMLDDGSRDGIDLGRHSCLVVVLAWLVLNQVVRAKPTFRITPPIQTRWLHLFSPARA